VDAVVSRPITEHAGHAHVERVVVLDPLLAAQGVPDWTSEKVRERDHLVVGAGHSGTGEDGHLLRLVDGVGQGLHVRVGRNQRRGTRAHEFRCPGG
jgi:hypothetical protein